MPYIEASLSIKRFKKGKKRRDDYKRPKETFEGTVIIRKKDVPSVVFLQGGNKKMPIRVNWSSYDGSIFCVVMVRSRVRFEILTQLPSGEKITSFKTCGQNYRTGKFTNWSAAITVIRRR